MGYVIPIDCTIHGKNYKGEIGIRADINKRPLLPDYYDKSDYNVGTRVFMWFSFDRKVQRNFQFLGNIDGKDWKGWECVNGKTIAGWVLKKIGAIHSIENDNSDYASNRVSEWKHFICENEIEEILCSELSKIINSAE